MQLNKFKEGDIVYEITRPWESLVISNRNGLIYSCRQVDRKKGHELTFMERDLRGVPADQVNEEKVRVIDPSRMNTEQTK